MPTVTTWTIDNIRQIGSAFPQDKFLSSEELAKVLDMSYMIDGKTYYTYKRCNDNVRNDICIWDYFYSSTVKHTEMLRSG